MSESVVASVRSSEKAEIFRHEALRLFENPFLVPLAFKLFCKYFFQRSRNTIQRTLKYLTFCFSVLQLFGLRRKARSWKLCVPLKLIMPWQIHIIGLLSKQTPRGLDSHAFLALVLYKRFPLLEIHKAAHSQVVFGRQGAIW